MSRDDSLLLDMLNAARKIRRFVAGMTEDDFKASELHQSAVLREIQVLGEAARQIGDDRKANLTDIPWRAIAGMRNRVIHEYFRVDVDVLWTTINTDIEALINQLEPHIGDDE